jgi:hypothetical protein
MKKHIMKKLLFTKASVLVTLMLMCYQTEAQSSLIGRGNPTFTIDCKGKYPTCAEEIVVRIEKSDIMEVRKNIYYQNTNREYFYFQFRVNEADYDSLFEYLKKKDVSKTNKLTNSTIQVSYANRYDTTQTYFQMKAAKDEMVRWKTLMDSTIITSPNYNQYLSRYNRASNNYFRYQKNLENLRKQAKHPFLFTIMVYKDQKNQYVTSKRKIRNKKEYKFTPSLSGGMIFPTNIRPAGGNYLGIVPEISLYTKWSNYSRRSPAYVRIAAGIGVYVNESSGNQRRYLYSLSGDASFENRINRKWMIPYFGMSTGFVNERILGSSLFIQPKVGLLLYANPSFHLFAEGGYFFATNNSRSYESSTVKAGLNMMLWKD